MKQIKKEDLISFLLAKYPTKEETPVLQEQPITPVMIERYNPEEEYKEKKNGGRKFMFWIGIVVLLLLVFLFMRRN